jgi:hypothetical protein
MTEQEAKQCIQGKLDCMNKCDVFDCKDTDECENCNYCYSQGNFGEQKKAFEIGIKALEKQIAKKPKEVKYSFGMSIGLCSCGKAIFQQMNYCGICGQKLDWGNEDA